jgi:aldose 1-epimerase
MRKSLSGLALIGLLVGGWAAGRGGADAVQRVEKQPFGKTASGQAVDLYVLKNKNGLEAAVATWGGTVVRLRVPDRQGQLDDVVLGFDSLDGYLGEHPYFGGVIGRYANRIAKGRFSLGGAEYTLARNNGENHLHGGLKGFDKVLWTAADATTNDVPAVRLSYVSKAGEEGYPGTLSATVTYSLTESGELRIDYSATADKDTVVNLTNHTYFNLAGRNGGDILGHEVEIRASRFTPIDAGLIPTGELKSVEGTPFDFRKATAIGKRIDADDEQIVRGKGYDHNFVLDGSADSLRSVARVREPGSGRVVEVLTTEPGLQFYSGNFLDGTVRGKGGKAYKHRYGFCMETQHFPDSPNKPEFPSVVLKPGQKYATSTVYKFTTDGLR